MVCIQLLLRHIPFADHTIYEPVRLYDNCGKRIYNEIYSANWWWDTQLEITEGGTLVPVLCASDKTQLTNFSGDKSAWPLYISIGNISKELRREKCKRAWILAAMLPIPSKDPGDGKIQDSWHDAIDIVLRPLKTVDVTGAGYEWDCSDGKRRRCYPVLAAWIADYPEHLLITKVRNGAYPMCEISKPEMGHETGPKIGKKRDAVHYQQLLGRDAEDELEALNVRPTNNRLWDYPLCDVYRLWQPDTLHQFYLGLAKTTIEWLMQYLERHGLMNRFNKRFKSIPPYPEFYPFRKAYNEVSKWQGKEIRMILRFLVPAIGPLLSGK